jgi:hypothetical protein
MNSMHPPSQEIVTQEASRDEVFDYYGGQEIDLADNPADVNMVASIEIVPVGQRKDPYLEAVKAELLQEPKLVEPLQTGLTDNADAFYISGVSEIQAVRAAIKHHQGSDHRLIRDLSGPLDLALYRSTMKGWEESPLFAFDGQDAHDIRIALKAATERFNALDEDERKLSEDPKVHFDAMAAHLLRVREAERVTAFLQIQQRTLGRLALAQAA